MWKNLLPHGSRVTELYSGIGIIIVSLCMGTSNFDLGNLIVLEPLLTWKILLLIFGSMQVYSIYKYPRVEILRVLLSWLTGCFWVWVGLSSISHLAPEDIAAVVLGISNLYGFIINSNILRIKWKY